jgi:hypothetical protein
MGATGLKLVHHWTALLFSVATKKNHSWPTFADNPTAPVPFDFVRCAHELERYWKAMNLQKRITLEKSRLRSVNFK